MQETPEVSGQGPGQPDGRSGSAMGSGSGSLGTNTPGGAEGVKVRAAAGPRAGSHRVGYAHRNTRPTGSAARNTFTFCCTRNASSWFWRRSRRDARREPLSPPVLAAVRTGGRHSLPGNPAEVEAKAVCEMQVPDPRKRRSPCASVT